MSLYLKIIGVVIFLAFILPSFVFCDTSPGESLTITTYYPSPFGVYKYLRLFPHDEQTPGAACSRPGEMYYDASDKALYICSDYTWKTVSGGAGSSGITFTYYCYNTTTTPTGLIPQCSNAGGSQGYCPAGCTQRNSVGAWGTNGNIFICSQP